MTDYLVYWKTFWDDVDDPEVIHDWHTNNEPFYRNVERGGNLWVVVSGGPDFPEEWRLLQRFFVERTDPELQKSDYGRYHIIGDEQQSELFDPILQPDFTPVFKRLEFASGKKIKLYGREIGRTIQTARRLSDMDVVLLKDYAAELARAG